MQSIFHNLINGNLSDARRQAKRVSWNKIFKYARCDLMWNVVKSITAADYLKAKDDEAREAFQQYCNAE